MTKKTTGNKIVKLMMYLHANDEIIIESFEAKDWGDFVIVSIDAEKMNDSVYSQLQDAFSVYATDMHKRMILVPRNMDIEFYGVEVAT